MTSLEQNRNTEAGTEMQGQLARERNRRRLMLLLTLLILIVQIATQLSYRVMAGSGLDGLQPALTRFLLEFSIWTLCNLMMARFVSWRATSIINGWSFIACFVVLSWITFFSGGTLQVLWLIRDGGLFGLAYIASVIAIFGMALTIVVLVVCLAALAIRGAWTRALT